MEWLLDLQKREAEAAGSDEERKAARKRYDDAVLALSKAFALAAASDEAKLIEAVKALMAIERGEVSAEVTSARTLSAAQNKLLAKTLKKSFGKEKA